MQLVFSEPLQSVLDASNLEISVGGVVYGFNVTVVDDRNRLIALTNVTSLSGDTSLIISLGSDIVSVENSLLSTSNLKSTLFVDTAVAAQIKLQVAKEAAKSTAAAGTTAGLSAVLGISILNFDPSSFCNFMNTAELFYSLYLFNIEIYPVLSGFLIGMRVESSLPNVFTYFISPSQGVTISDQYQAYGFKTNLVMLNVGVRFSVLILFILIGLLLRILSTYWKISRNPTRIIETIQVWSVFKILGATVL